MNKYILLIVNLLVFTTTVTHSQPVLYDRGAACNYSDLYWNTQNPNFNYYSFGDCTNFASQCMKAGGCNMSSDPQNYYDDFEYKTVDIYRDNKGMIVNVAHLNGWLRSHSDEPELIWSIGQPSNKIVFGDIIIFGDYNTDPYHHTTFVVQGSGYSVMLNAHTNARFHEPFSFYFGMEGGDKWNTAHCYHIISTGAATTVQNAEEGYGSGCYFAPTSARLNPKSTQQNY